MKLAMRSVAFVTELSIIRLQKRLYNQHFYYGESKHSVLKLHTLARLQDLHKERKELLSQMSKEEWRSARRRAYQLYTEESYYKI